MLGCQICIDECRVVLQKSFQACVVGCRDVVVRVVFDCVVCVGDAIDMHCVK